MNILVVENPKVDLPVRRRSRSVLSIRGAHTLPHSVGNDPLWRTKFIPTAIALYGLEPDVWKYDPKKIAPVLQMIWDAVFPGPNRRSTANLEGSHLLSGDYYYNLISFLTYTEAIFRQGKRSMIIETTLARRLLTPWHSCLARKAYLARRRWTGRTIFWRTMLTCSESLKYVLSFTSFVFALSHVLSLDAKDAVSQRCGS